MDDSAEDIWPVPHFHPGPPKHLHAIGVIAITFAQLERSIDDLFMSKAEQIGMPRQLSMTYYYGLTEDKRLDAFIALFSEENEQEEALRNHVSNIAKCFDWARDCRNKILHSELHPISFYFSNQELLYLTKRKGKTTTKSGYMDFDLPNIRAIAERMRAYVARSAELSLYLRFRDKPIEKLDSKYLVFRNLSTELLKVQPKLELRDFPERSQLR